MKSFTLFFTHTKKFCKWQHLKSSAVLQWIDEQEIVPSLQAPEGEEFYCAGCNTDLGGLNYIEVKFFKSMFLMGGKMLSQRISVSL